MVSKSTDYDRMGDCESSCNRRRFEDGCHTPCHSSDIPFCVGAGSIDLDSAVFRKQAHKFYFKESFHIFAYKFSRDLKECPPMAKL